MILAALALATSPSPSLQSDPYAALSACRVRNISSGDRLTLARWAYAIYSEHGQVKDLSTVTPAQRDALSKEAGMILNRLMLQDCRTEAIAALANPKSTRDAVLRQMFDDLFVSAVDALMDEPTVNGVMQGLVAGLNIRGWRELEEEASKQKARE